jgi:hypothetical protein
VSIPQPGSSYFIRPNSTEPEGKQLKKKLLVPLSLALLAMAMFGGVASAAQPNNKACYGKNISAAAQSEYVDLGPLVSYTARTVETWFPDVPGLGNTVQWIQAGNPTPLGTACN